MFHTIAAWFSGLWAAKRRTSVSSHTISRDDVVDSYDTAVAMAKRIQRMVTSLQATVYGVRRQAHSAAYVGGDYTLPRGQYDAFYDSVANEVHEIKRLADIVVDSGKSAEYIATHVKAAAAEAESLLHIEVMEDVYHLVGLCEDPSCLNKHKARLAQKRKSEDKLQKYIGYRDIQQGWITTVADEV